MNNKLIFSRVQMEAGELQQLVAEVKETIAADVLVHKSAKANSFKAINFWSLRRKGRYVNYGSRRKKNTILSLTHVAF